MAIEKDKIAGEVEGSKQLVPRAEDGREGLLSRCHQ